MARADLALRDDLARDGMAEWLRQVGWRD